MPTRYRIMVGISFILFLISFSISLASNIVLDALFRSFVVFIGSFLAMVTLSYFFQQMLKTSTVSAANKSDTTANNIGQEESEEGKGGFVDLSTPEEDQFVPFNPKEMYERDQ